MYYFYLLIMAHTVLTKSTITKDFMDVNDSEPESEIADILMSKGYLPNDKDLPKSTLIKESQNDEAYLLSKLSDEELIKLLTEHSNKKIYSLYDLMAVKGNIKHKTHESVFRDQNIEEVDDSTKNKKNANAFYRLENKEIPQQQNNEDYIAWKKINSLLNVLPQRVINKEEKNLDAEKKELLFDILVAQLKSLCCKKKSNRQEWLSSLPKNVKQSSSVKLPYQKATNQKSGEFMFLVINDEIKSKSSNELVLVDPDSIEKNSSVLLLGPITTPLSDKQLKTVMHRLSSELSKPEYLTLLEQLSKGTLSENNKKLMDKFVIGPKTRRYIKPHRCNHQSKLARVYGGPKWLICTGYLNLNVPSLYD